ncbi:YkgJ family cysteine cluster protein [Desulfosarcina ovata]|uniref:Zinc/iron-chelating domain-containing protein n=2 Tax=Desulfosarcina ovata TaxID=83564 RepID=A0A5K8A8W9_9BACT|nr:YkgJ family cysteine cluster protein [Desulfosarcina ovata]BBO81674.1 hypothetical protein DSCO28_22400 [Desulfosarcina ovata subsp. sediminis]BBO88909.1 hypothetical protein DSCOOX_20890 [Desulfosarcina ovata subsp. ovata]
MESDETCEELFCCTLCGDCCKGFGGTYLTERDIDAIARFLKIGKDELVRGYTQRSGSKRVIAQGDNGYCIFWDKVCTIHPVKPWMCRQWPFIPGVLADVNNWRAMAASCPGMNTALDDRQILACVKKKMTPKPK